MDGLSELNDLGATPGEQFSTVLATFGQQIRETWPVLKGKTPMPTPTPGTDGRSDRNTNIMWAVGGLAVAGVAGYFIWKKFLRKK